RKANLVGLPDVSRSEAPRDVYEGTESFSGDAQYRKPGYSHLAQPAEPPYADPHVRWGGGEDGCPFPLSRLRPVADYLLPRNFPQAGFWPAIPSLMPVICVSSSG